MPQSSAERQARYRARKKAKAGLSLEQAIERIRQDQIDEWIRQSFDDTSSEREIAMLRAFKAEPPRTGEAFRDWLERLLWADLGESIRAYRKVWSRKGRRGRVGSAETGAGSG